MLSPMSQDDYTPISCDLHSEYELLALHRTPVTLHYRDEEGAEQHLQGRVTDVFTRDGAEFLRLETEAGTAEIRLDRIDRVRKH